MSTENINNTITDATKMMNKDTNIFRITSSREITSHIPSKETTVINNTNVIKMYEVTFFNPFITLVFWPARLPNSS